MGLTGIVGGREILKRGRDAAAMDAGGGGRQKARKDQGVGILRYQPLVLYGVPDWSRTSGLSHRVHKSLVLHSKNGFLRCFILKTVAYILHQYPVVSFSLTPMHSIGGVWVAISKYARPASSPPLLSRNEPPHGTGRRHPPPAGSAASPPERTPYSCPRFNLLASLAELFEEGTDSCTTVAVPSPQDEVRSASMITVA